jgi:hypothetical protein
MPLASLRGPRAWAVEMTRSLGQTLATASASWSRLPRAATSPIATQYEPGPIRDATRCAAPGRYPNTAAGAGGTTDTRASGTANTDRTSTRAVSEVTITAAARPSESAVRSRVRPRSSSPSHSGWVAGSAS